MGLFAQLGHPIGEESASGILQPGRPVWRIVLREIGAFEAKNTFGSLLDLVQKGEEVVITRHGKPVARLRARKLARTSPLPSVDDWLAFKNDGRK